MDGGVNAFALQVIDDALLVVDASRFLFANNALEELCGSPSNTLLQQPTTFMPDEERLEFFRLVNEHCEEEGDNTDLLSETFVECIHQRAGAFLSKVTFHPYRGPIQRPSSVCASFHIHSFTSRCLIGPPHY